MTEGDRLCPYCTKPMQRQENRWTEWQSFFCISCKIDVDIRERNK